MQEASREVPECTAAKDNKSPGLAFTLKRITKEFLWRKAENTHKNDKKTHKSLLLLIRLVSSQTRAANQKL